MLNSMTLRNVRVFKDNDTTIKLGKLSVLCGTNSSGKSSIIKSILLLRQSQGIHEPISPRNGYLRFVGTQVDLGQYSTFVSDRNFKNNISIGLTLPHPLSKNRLAFLRGLKENTQEIIEFPNNPSITSGQINAELDVKFVFHAADSHFSDNHNIDKSPMDRNSSARILGQLKSALFAIKSGDEILLEWEIYLKQPGVSEDENLYFIRMPEKYFGEVGGYNLMEANYFRNEKHVEFPVILDGLLPDAILGLAPKKEKNTVPENKEKWITIILPPHIEKALSSLKNTLTDMQYIGPLRSPAKRYYLTSYDAPPTLDPVGEFLPYLFTREYEPEVVCVSPKNTESKKIKLFQALELWLHYIRTGDINPQLDQQKKEVKVSSSKGVLVELEVQSPNNSGLHSLADSGFGYSQLLPILARGLLAKKNDILIIEQPELHLNPSIQIRMAEFLVSLVLAGKQVIFETHSEHMVNAIRVLIAEDKTKKLDGKSKIFFIRTQDNGPQIQELSIFPDGNVKDWPYEFFGEAANLAGRLLRAQNIKSKGITTLKD